MDAACNANAFVRNDDFGLGSTNGMLILGDLRSLSVLANDAKVGGAENGLLITRLAAAAYELERDE